MKYKVTRTTTADQSIRKLMFHIATNFSKDVAKEFLDNLENQINNLKENPYLGTIPNDTLLRIQGYRTLISKKNIIFYKIKKEEKTIVIYYVFSNKQDYLNIIKGLV